MNISNLKHMTKKIIFSLLLGFVLLPLFSEEITDRISSYSHSATVDFFNPPSFLTDGDAATSCQFYENGKTAWIEINFEDSYEVHGLKFDGHTYGSNLHMEIEYFDNTGWIPFSLSRTEGNEIFEDFIDLSYDRKVSNRIRVSFGDDNLGDTELYSLMVYGKQPEEVFSLIEVSQVESSFNTSHFYSADYLIDRNARTEWAAYPHLYKKFPGKFQKNEYYKFDDVCNELDSIRNLNALMRSFYSFYTSLDAELLLETPSEAEYINLYFTDDSEGDFTLSVFSEGQWYEIFTQYDTEDLEAGWVHIEVDSFITSIDKVKVHFEGDKLRLGGLSEVEIWGTGSYYGNRVINIPVSSSNTLEKALVFEADLERKQHHFMDIQLENTLMEFFDFDFNGRTYSAERQISRSGNSLYRTEIEMDHIWDDGNYITIPALGTSISVDSIKIFDRKGDLSIPFDNQLSDGYLYNSDDSKSSVQFDFDKSTYLNKLNLHSFDGANGDVLLHDGTEWQEQNDYDFRNDIVYYDIFNKAEKIIIDSGLFSGIGEIEFLGSPLEYAEPEVRILWPADGSVQSKGFTNMAYLVGFIDNPDATVTVNGERVRQEGHSFWISMRHFDVDENGAMFLDAVAETPEGETSTHSIMVFEDGYMMMYITPEEETVFTDDETLTFNIYCPPSMRIIAEKDNETWQVNGSWWGSSLTVPLDEGFNLLTIKGVNKRNGKIYRIINKKIIRNSSGISIDILTPAEGTWTNTTSTSVEGVVIGSGDYSLTVNELPASIVGNSFSAGNIPLVEGENHLSIIAEDETGSIFGIDHVIYNDVTAPVLSVEKPEEGDYYNTGYIEILGTVTDANQSVVSVQDKQYPVVNGEFNAQVYLVNDGPQIIKLQARDIAGNLSALVERTVTVDSTPPLPFDIESDADGWTNSSPTLSFSTTDETSGLSHYEISVNGSDFQEVSSPYTVPLTVDGELKVYFKAFDNVGNFRTEETYIYIDTTAPVSPPNFRAVPGNGMVETRWDASDEDVVEYRISRTDEIEGTLAFTTSELFYEEMGTTNGEIYEYSIVAVDRAGNLSDLVTAESIICGVAVGKIVEGSDELLEVEYDTSTLYITPNSLPEEVTKVTISEVESEGLVDLASYELMSPIYNYSVVVEMDGVEIDQEHVEFSEPFIAEIDYDESLLPEEMTEEDLKVFYFDSMWSRWVKVDDYDVDVDANKILFITDHFSDFSVQATDAVELSLQELMEMGISGLDSDTTYQDVSISPQGGSANTSVIEFVLPGIGGFNFELKRTYSTGLAKQNAIYYKYRIQNSKKTTIDNVLHKNGEYGFSMGSGWQLDLPYVATGSFSNLVSLPGGSVHTFSSLDLTNTIDDGNIDSSIWPVSSEEEEKVLVFQTHENSDFKMEVRVHSTQISEEHNTRRGERTRIKDVWKVTDSILTLKDGTIWKFNSHGSPISMTDPTKINNLKIQYTNRKISTIDLEIQDPSLENQEWSLDFTYDTDDVYVFPVIKKIEVNGNDIRTRAVEYSVEKGFELKYLHRFIPKLTSAIDVIGRISSYTYTLKKLNKGKQEAYLLNGITSPGLGYTSIVYDSLTLKEAKRFLFFRWSRESERFVAKSKIIKDIKEGNPINTTTYMYDFDHIDDGQFISVQSIVDDGQHQTIYNYKQKIKKRPIRLIGSDEAEAVYENGKTKDVIPYNTSIVIPGIETTHMTYDLSTMRVTSEKRVRAADNYSQSTYRYDTWGNRNYVKNYSQTGDRNNTTETWTYFKNGGTNASSEVLWKTEYLSGTALSGTGIHTKPLQRIVRNTIPTEEGSTTQDIYTAWDYNSSGLMTSKTEWVDDVIPVSSYEYDSYGNMSKITNPEGHETTIEYNYSPEGLTGQYTVTSTEVGVTDADGTIHNIISSSGYENTTGWKLWDINPRGYQTTYTLDDLGRTIKSEFEGSTTDIIFDDTNLDTTVITTTDEDSTGTKVIYDYDMLGRLINVTKDIRTMDENFAYTDGIQQSIYILGYDAWGNVTSLSDPNGNDTKYEYDSMNRMNKIIHPEENGIEYSKTMTFDYATNVQTIIDEEDNLSYETYDFSGRLIQLVQDFGTDDITSYTYFDGLGNEVKRIDGNGNSTSVIYNERQQPIETLLPEEIFFENGAYITAGPFSRTEYDLTGVKTRDIIDTADGEYEVLYISDEVGRVIKTQKAVGGSSIEEKSYYDDNGNVIKSIDGNGLVRTFDYTSRDQLVTEHNPAGGKISYTYDLRDRKLSMTDPRENSKTYPGLDFTIDYIYDDLDRIVGAKLPETSSFAGKPVIRFEYDLKGNVLKQINPDGGETIFTYSERNNKETQTIQGTNLSGTALSYTTTYSYDGLKNLSEIMDPAGNITTQVYDSLRRLTAVHKPERNNVFYEYDNVGNVTAIEDGKLNKTKTSYDSYNRVDYVEDALGGITDFSYDRKGNQTRYVDSNNNATTYVYDELNRLVEERNALDEVHTYSYDKVGNVKTHTDPEETLSIYEYNDLYLQTKLTLSNTERALTKIIENSWDEAGDIIWSTDDGVRTEYNTVDTYTPDPYSRVLNISRFIDEKKISTSYEYDVMNRITAMVYPSGETVEYDYNNISQLEKVPGYINQSIEYDARGFLEGYSNAAGIEALFDFDNSSRQTGISYESNEEILKSFVLEYDKADNIAKKNNSSYSYDSLNRLKHSNEVGKFAVDVNQKKLDNPDYTQDIGMVDFDVSAQKRIDFESDEVDLKLDYASTSIGVNLGYETYVTHVELRTKMLSHRIDETNTEVFISSTNSAGGYDKLTDWIWEEEDGVITITFREPVYGSYLKIHSLYDERDKDNEALDMATFKNSQRNLLTVFYTANYRDEEFVYDSKGNRLTSNTATSLYTTLEDEEGRVYTYYDGSDRLKTVESTSEGNIGYQWNSNGNMTARGSTYSLDGEVLVFDKTNEGYTEYEYDLLNRLVEVRKTDELGVLKTIADYTYDTKGYRIKKEGVDGIEYFAFSLDGLLLREENIDKDSLVEYVYAFNKVIAERRDGEEFFYLTDHLGSTVMMTDDQGNILWQNDVTPFGEETGESGFVHRDGFYTGKKIDRDTGLYYFNARWYDPQLGRFITEDPVKDGINFFSYVANNPLTFVDPTGLYGMTADDYNSMKVELKDSYKEYRERQNSNNNSGPGQQNDKSQPEFNNNENPTTWTQDNWDNWAEKQRSWIIQTEIINSNKYGLDELLNLTRNADLMGKLYAEGFLCDDFGEKLLNAIGNNSKKYLPDGAKSLVTTNMDTLNVLGKLDKKSSLGWNVFYKRKDDGKEGHFGFVYFEEDSSHIVLHNGYAPEGDDRVNYLSRTGSFDSFFKNDRKNSILYYTLRK